MSSELLGIENLVKKIPNGLKITDFQKILRWGMNVNCIVDNSPLLFHFASCPSKGDNFKILCMLIDLGADLNAQDDLGLTCLTRAQGQSLSEVKTVRLLVEAGADLDVQDKRYRNRTVLMISLFDFCALDIISMFIHAGADVNLRNTRKMTALMCAVTPEDIQYQAGYPEKAVRMLLDAESDVSARDHKNRTALSYTTRRTNSVRPFIRGKKYCRSIGYTKIITMLIEAIY